MIARAWKFLGRGACSAFAHEPWPNVGRWCSSENGADGVLVLTADDLAWWIADELWEVEAELAERATNVTNAQRARLIRRVTAWDRTAAGDFVAHVRDVAGRLVNAGGAGLAARLVGDLAGIGSDHADVASYIAAMASAATGVTEQEHRTRSPRLGSRTHAGWPSGSASPAEPELDLAPQLGREHIE